MPTPEDYALAAASSANDALLSALLATAKSVLTSEDEVAAAQWAADAHAYMLNCQNGVSIVNNNAAIEAAVLALSTDFATKYLGSHATAPVTTQEGAQYWNSTSNLMYTWNGSSWTIPVPVFDGLINAGTSSTPVGKVQLRRDLAGSWTVANPILSIGELGIETDTGFVKIGNGTSAWVDLLYSGSPKSAISGINNVDNTSDINKPVSTLQTAAITASLNTAKAYTDTSNLGHLVDVGGYNVALTNAYPITGGTGALGAILKGNVFNITNSGTINTINLLTGDSLRALVDNPTQSDTDWLITTKPVSNSKPYIVVLNIPNNVISDYNFPAHIFTLTTLFPINFSLSKAHSRVYSTNTFIFTIKKNGISVGTITFAANATVGTFIAASAITFYAGDILEISSQVTPDASLSDISISLLGSRI